ncbi:Exo-alpha-sialidase [Aspergillus lucknowensis]|uniref:Exo-alpha-sialidase n=1 Tax=Aspergillus lucknowensis TaxID=176173 RepID=A0ABR4LGZ2_9EURO
MYLPALLALLATSACAFPITGTDTNCRTGPGTSFSSLKTYPKDTDVKLECQTPGEAVFGNSIWDKTTDGCYVADYYSHVDDPAEDAAQSHQEFAIFRPTNMASPDKLANGVSFHSFRIPAVITTKTGRIIAFCEGRRHSSLDYGDINLVYKRTKTTTDNGRESSDWESLKEVWGAGAGTWGNPTPVVDDDNTIYLWLSWNEAGWSQNGEPDFNGEPTKKIDTSWEGRRHLYLTISKDDGETWSTPVDYTKTLTPEEQAWDAVGPGNGIRLTTGELVVPAQARNLIGRGTPGNRTWEMQPVPGGGSEGTIVELPNGKLQRNDRKSGGYRIIADGDLNGWGSFRQHTGLPDPGCQASILNYNRGEKGLERTIFMNSASKDSRQEMRVRITYDEDAGKYDYGRAVNDATVSGTGYHGGYSSMCKTNDWHVGALVETDFLNDRGTPGAPHRAIVWRRFNLSWILNGPNN